MRVMIVDDVKQVRDGLRTALPLAAAAQGLQVEIVGEAADGRQALELAAALRPDVILMDLEMPEMDGVTTARRIKRAGSPARILALTVHDDPVTRGEAAEAGLDGFIVKGVAIAEIVQSLGQLGEKESRE